MSFLKLITRAGALCSAAMLMLCAAGCKGSEEDSGSSSGTSASQVSIGNAPEVTGNVTITTWKLGKADSFVIQTENSVTVVDAGLQGDGKTVQKFLEAQNIDTIDNLIITHYDKDHVGGATRLVNRMKINNIYVPDYIGTADEYADFMAKVEEVGQTLTKMEAGTGTSWTADDAAFYLYAAQQTYYSADEENDFSIVLYMQHGENTFLFTGDAEKARQQEIMAYGFGEVDFLKFPYHGHYLSTTESFLDYFNPSVTVVTCSKSEDADPSTYETLEKRGVEAYYTKDGDVTVVSDGTTLTCTQTAS